MTATMYDDNDAESSGGWRHGAPPPASESNVRFTVSTTEEGQGR
jgi:hypothetical protein